MDGDVDWCKITATLHSTIISQHNDLRGVLIRCIVEITTIEEQHVSELENKR